MQLFYRKFGEGHPFIILHGLYGSSDNWVTVGKELGNYFEIYLVDQRNHGQSPHSEDHNYQLLKEDIKDFMDQHFLEKAIIMGHSMGGKTAMKFAVDYPGRVSRLIVVDIAPKAYSTSKDDTLQTLNHDQIIAAMLGLDLDKMNSREDIDKELTKSIKSDQIRQFILKNVRRTKDNKYTWLLNIKAINNNFNKILEGLDFDKDDGSIGITGFPVLFIRGGKSEYILEEDVSPIKTIFPTAELVTISNTGHWVHAEQPGQLIQVVKNFVFG